MCTVWKHNDYYMKWPVIIMISTYKYMDGTKLGYSLNYLPNLSFKISFILDAAPPVLLDAATLAFREFVTVTRLAANCVIWSLALFSWSFNVWPDAKLAKQIVNIAIPIIFCSPVRSDNDMNEFSPVCTSYVYWHEKVSSVFKWARFK